MRETTDRISSGIDTSSSSGSSNLATSEGRQDLERLVSRLVCYGLFTRLATLICRHRFSAIIGLFYVAGLVHTKGNFARMAISRRFRRGYVALPVGSDGYFDVVTDSFRIGEFAVNQVHADYALKVAISAVMLGTINHLHGDQALQHILNVILVLFD